MDSHADRRDVKIHKRKYGMRVSGRGLKSVILPLLAKKAGNGTKSIQTVQHRSRRDSGDLD
jgi:hypothetical protein